MRFMVQENHFHQQRGQIVSVEVERIRVMIVAFHVNDVDIN